MNRWSAVCRSVEQWLRPSRARCLIIPLALMALLVSTPVVVVPAAETTAVSATASATMLATALRPLRAEVPGLHAGDARAVGRARTALAGWTTAWAAVENGIRTSDRKAYAAIEEAAGDLAYALDPASTDGAAAAAAIDQLATACAPLLPVAAGAAPVVAPVATPAAGSAERQSFAQVLERARSAHEAAEAGQRDTALSALTWVRAAWPDVEARVATTDSVAYRTIEDRLARAAAQLKNHDAGAAATLGELVHVMTPFASSATYTWMDPFLIIVREGLEALLVVASLLMWLSSAGKATKQATKQATANSENTAESPRDLLRARRWVILGAVAGVALSLVLAVVIQAAFQHLVTGARRELVEGVVGLFAAVLLVWVAWWLHRQTMLLAWSGFLKERVRQLASAGGRWTLAGLAFLAVVREGAETALFLVGLMPAIATADLLLGLAAGAGVLAVVGVVILGLGIRLPVGPTLRLLTLLLVWLAFKFTGAGIQALQVAGLIDASVIGWWPALPVAGLFPTLQAIAAQGVLVVILALLAWRANRAPQIPPSAACAVPSSPVRPPALPVSASH